MQDQLRGNASPAKPSPAARCCRWQRLLFRGFTCDLPEATAVFASGACFSDSALSAFAEKAAGFQFYGFIKFLFSAVEEKVTRVELFRVGVL